MDGRAARGFGPRRLSGTSGAVCERICLRPGFGPFDDVRRDVQARSLLRTTVTSGARSGDPGWVVHRLIAISAGSLRARGLRRAMARASENEGGRIAGCPNEFSAALSIEVTRGRGRPQWCTDSFLSDPPRTDLPQRRNLSVPLQDTTTATPALLSASAPMHIASPPATN